MLRTRTPISINIREFANYRRSLMQDKRGDFLNGRGYTKRTKFGAMIRYISAVRIILTGGRSRAKWH